MILSDLEESIIRKYVLAHPDDRDVIVNMKDWVLIVETMKGGRGCRWVNYRPEPARLALAFKDDKSRRIIVGFDSLVELENEYASRTNRGRLSPSKGLKSLYPKALKDWERMRSMSDK